MDGCFGLRRMWTAGFEVAVTSKTPREALVGGLEAYRVCLALGCLLARLGGSTLQFLHFNEGRLDT
jgi:hypothetical protein